jgi:NADH:ubiquinone oxidoreductase subunit 5 (subunit L)/multisubunit Na+/H+ antiporter MnhA subunit
MRWHPESHAQSAVRPAEVPWPMRVVRGVLLLILIFGGIAAFAWLFFGRNSEVEVLGFGEDLIEIVAIVLVPVLLIGLIVLPLYRWSTNKLTTKLISTDPLDAHVSDQDRQGPQHRR